jgi:hypothetical protein
MWLINTFFKLRVVLSKASNMGAGRCPKSPIYLITEFRTVTVVPLPMFMKEFNPSTVRPSTTTSEIFSERSANE